MCGIAGLVRTSGTDEEGLRLTSGGIISATEAVRRMVDSLRHRGPDDHRLEVVSSSGASVVLGHTRLAIIDLSSAGRQPMQSGDTGRAITYNGEIYNYQALRQELSGRQWRSHSDTEVLLEAYATWGRRCVEKLRGMFAFAVWDDQQQELFVARDRLGIKPLYYYSIAGGEGSFVFASEVRALLASGLVPRRLDPLGLGEYLTYQSLPAPRTLIEGVRALPPGGWLVVKQSGHIEEGRYWDLLQHAAGDSAELAPLASQRRLSELLRESVALHLVSDVPVGAFLSGGIDSTAVVGLMREAGHTPHTFSVSFAERAYDETQFARSVAARFDTEHTEIRLGERELLSQVPAALTAMDQPTGDGVNTYVVAGAVRAAGIKVALSGLGGDELFAGYPSFARLSGTANWFRTWGRAPDPVRALAARTLQVVGRSSSKVNKAAAMLSSRGHLANLYPLTRQIFSAVERQALLTTPWSQPLTEHADPYAQMLETAYRDGPPAGVLTSISYAEARTYMHDVLLRDTDQMSMAHGLEVRVPFLDHVLVEYVMGLPDAHKRARGTPKRLLVDSLAPLLPDDIVHRPKQGFSLPFDVWLRGDLRSLCQERLGARGLAGRDIFEPQAVHHLWHAFLGRKPFATWSRVWILVVLEDWLEQNGF